MAKKGQKVRTRTIVKRSRSRSSGGFGRSGVMKTAKNVGVGAAGAIAAQFGGNLHAQYGPAAGMALVGHFAGNETLQTLAGLSIGNQLGGMLGGLTGSGGYGAGGY